MQKNLSQFQLQQSTVKYGFSFRTLSDRNTKMGCHVHLSKHITFNIARPSKLMSGTNVRSIKRVSVSPSSICANKQICVSEFRPSKTFRAINVHANKPVYGCKVCSQKPVSVGDACPSKTVSVGNARSRNSLSAINVHSTISVSVKNICSGKPVCRNNVRSSNCVKAINVHPTKSVKASNMLMWYLSC